MKTIGLLGGMSWESSAEYYRIINEEVRRRLGATHSAECVMWSFDFHRIETMQEAGMWDEAARVLSDAARRLEQAGAELLVVCTNTMHRLAPAIEAEISIPLLHIADATAGAVKAAGVGSVGLLGTRYTMEHDFYRGRLESKHGLAVVIPDEPDRTRIHEVIYRELVRGVIDDRSRTAYREIIDRLIERGAAGIIAGCTEIELLVRPGDLTVPYFPTTRLHAERAVEVALSVD